MIITLKNLISLFESYNFHRCKQSYKPDLLWFSYTSIPMNICVNRYYVGFIIEFSYTCGGIDNEIYADTINISKQTIITTQIITSDYDLLVREFLKFNELIKLNFNVEVKPQSHQSITFS